MQKLIPLARLKNKAFHIAFLLLGLSGSAQTVDSIVVRTGDSIIIRTFKQYQGGRIGGIPMYGTDSLLKTDYQTENPAYQHRFPTSFQKNFKGQDFDYSLNKPKESLWGRFLKALHRILGNIFGGTGFIKADRWAILVLRLLALAALGFALYFLIRFILNKRGNWIFNKKMAKLNPGDETITENIYELNLPELIADCEQKKDFRFAIRYYFLLFLKELTDKGILEWTPEKTNRDYLQKLSGSKWQPKFGKLAYVFENIWYGERKIDADDYRRYRDEFKAILQEL